MAKFAITAPIRDPITKGILLSFLVGCNYSTQASRRGFSYVHLVRYSCTNGGESGVMVMTVNPIGSLTAKPSAQLQFAATFLQMCSLAFRDCIYRVAANLNLPHILVTDTSCNEAFDYTTVQLCC